MTCRDRNTTDHWGDSKLPKLQTTYPNPAHGVSLRTTQELGSTQYLASLVLPVTTDLGYNTHPDGVMVPAWWPHSLNTQTLVSGIWVASLGTTHLWCMCGVLKVGLIQFVLNKVTPCKFSPGYFLCSSYNTALVFPVTKPSSGQSNLFTISNLTDFRGALFHPHETVITATNEVLHLPP